ncbi:OsmC family protein [Hymenobacter glacialis]|uniref:Osmotically inducible protein OsmC n=1 Tax=Hymenobacter glacialis TaxID=1908236 RepID=A0A1G1ST07_9BACT|nr:OsmC family protein [Hymenobacter glacialis]OGX81753.1 osmotically inducible protein OsmC [Hymenobacter glacialis]
MNTATARYAGHLRTEATHAASGNVIQTDAPTDNHGRGEAFSPTDLVCTALGSCMMTVMGIVADRHSLDLVNSTFAVVKHMSTEAPRRIAQIDVTFTLPAALSPNDRSLLERTARTCPVALSLHPDIKQNVMFEYK